MSTRSPARSAPNTSPATTPPRKAPPMNEHPISDDERARRQKAIDFARTHIELPGFALSPGMAALGVRFVACELSENEYIAAPPAHPHTLPAHPPAHRSLSHPA